MRRTLLRVLPSIAFLSACSGGVGPVGIGSIGEREDPAGGAASAGSSGRAPSSSGGSPSSSGGASGGTLVCSGSYACSTGATVTNARLSQKSGGCEADIAGDEYVLTPDGKITVDGDPFGTWRTSGGSVIVCDQKNDCVTCVPSSTSGGTDAGAGG